MVAGLISMTNHWDIPGTQSRNQPNLTMIKSCISTSSSAAAAVAYKLNLCDQEITVEMAGGELSISISPDFDISMSGPVTKIAEGFLSKELFSAKI